MAQISRKRFVPPDPTRTGLPAAVDSERMILGLALADPRYLAEARALTVDDFDLQAHRVIFNAVVGLDRRGVAVDRVTVAEALRATRQLKTVGGLSYLVSLDDGLPRVSTLRPHLDLVRDKALRRRFIFGANDLVARALADGEQTGDLIAENADLLRSLGSANGKGGASSVFTWANVPSVFDFEAEITWIVDGLIPEGAITLFTGDAGVGKSIFATSMAGAIVRCEPFLGRATTQRMVLYCDRENGLAVVKQHLFDLKIGRTDDLVYWGTWCGRPPDGPGAASLLELARDRKPVIIFDSLVAFHPGDEQDASETRRFLQLFRNLAAAGATVVVLHHIGKSDGAKQYRGSSDIKAAVDCAYLLERSAGDPAGLLSDLRLVPFKNRIGASTPLQLTFENGVFRTHVRSETTRETVERLVSESPGSSYDELTARARSAGLSKHQAEDELSKGVAEARFEVRRVGHKKLYFIREVELGEV